jgi:hypothetical protein
MSDPVVNPQSPNAIDPNAQAPTAQAPTAQAPTATVQSPTATAPNPLPVPSSLQQQQAQAQQAQAQQAQNVARHALFGAAVKSMVHSLNGTETSYQVNPQTGVTEETTVKAPPGRFFKNLLAGMLIGSAAGAERTGQPGSGTLVAGLGRGVNAEAQRLQFQDQQKREAAQQQFQNQMKAEQNQREKDDFKTEQDMKRANIALLNIQTLHQNFLMTQATFDDAEKMATAGKNSLQPYVEAGLPYVYTDKPESEMHELWQSNPMTQHYQWAVTGVKPIITDGKPSYEKTYSAIDPEGKVKVTQGILDNFKRVKLNDFYPDVDTLRVGQEIDAKQMMALQHIYQDVDNKQRKQKEDDLREGKESAEIMRDRAQAARDLQDVAKGKLETKQSQLYGEALNEYNQVGGDFSKLSPKSQVILAESTVKLITSLTGVARAQIQEGDDEAAKETYHTIGQLSSLIPKAFQQKTNDLAALPKPQKQGQQISPENVQTYVDYEQSKNPNWTPTQIRQAARQDITNAGWTIPSIPGAAAPRPGPLVAAPSTGNTGVPGQDQLPPDARR